MRRLVDFFVRPTMPHALPTDLGLTLLRVATGLALAIVFEKVLPREGVWGPQAWFVADVAAMGFPYPAFFAWAAALAEFVGGLLLVVGLATRPAALLNAIVLFVAAFLHHGGDIALNGLMAFTFFIMTVTLLLTGPGRFSLDHLIATRLYARRPAPVSDTVTA
ncbi:MAG: DoxX family membrane protein [Bacteroidota bacterium]